MKISYLAAGGRWCEVRPVVTWSLVMLQCCNVDLSVSRLDELDAAACLLGAALGSSFKWPKGWGRFSTLLTASLTSSFPFNKSHFDHLMMDKFLFSLLLSFLLMLLYLSCRYIYSTKSILNCDSAARGFGLELSTLSWSASSSLFLNLR